MATTVQAAVIIDARGSFCPGPLMELIRGIRQANVGETIEVWSTDQGSRKDIPFWVQKAGHELVGVFDDPSGYARFVVRKLR